MSLEISQNFLINKNLLKKLVDRANFSKEDVVYDIGAGRGLISHEIADRCSKVVAFEYDPKLEPSLRYSLREKNNVEVIIGDFLRYKIPSGSKYKVFSNIPFSISSDIFNKLYFGQNSPSDCFIFVQKEAALRFMGKGEGLLVSLVLKPFYEVGVIYEFSKDDFEPRPSVDVVLLRIKKIDKPNVKDGKEREYRNFIAYTLLQQKPTVKLRLSKVFTSEQFKRLSSNLNFSIDSSSNQLSLTQWVGLFNYYDTGVVREKKEIVNQIGDLYFKTKANFFGPSRTKIRL